MIRQTISRGWPFAVLIAAWQMWVWLGRVPVIVAPAPLAVVTELVRHPRLYATEAAVTLAVAAAGLVLGTALACVAAPLGWFSPLATGIVLSPAVLAQATPVVAILPVVARVLGYNDRTIVAAAALITLFPTFALVSSGLRNVPAGAPDLFAVLGAGRSARLRLLALPSAVPNVLVALRIAAANCIVAALIAEYMMGGAGLGRLFAVASGRFDTESAWAAFLVATALSVGSYFVMRRVEGVIGRQFQG